MQILSVNTTGIAGERMNSLAASPKGWRVLGWNDHGEDVPRDRPFAQGRRLRSLSSVGLDELVGKSDVGSGASGSTAP